MAASLPSASAGLGIWLLTSVAAVACAGLLTRAAIAYAQRKVLLDPPGRRRSHDVPTPRGGGVAIIATMLAGIAAAGQLAPGPSSTLQSWPAWLAVAMVAGIGWLDDHRELRARTRLLVQIAAVTLVLCLDASVAELWRGRESGVTALLCLAIVGLALLWSINLHNFMDGINGLLAFQAVFVFLAIGVVLGHEPALWIGAAAVLGFLPFNFPQARIFMGDVGSGALGLVIGLAVLGHVASSGFAPVALYAGLVLCSAFAIDAGCTLLSRMLRGRRWYSAHREHLYQWLVRSGFSHAQVVAMYMSWNVLVALPVAAYLSHRPTTMAPAGIPGWLSPAVGIHVAVATALLAVLVWCQGKRWCLRHAHQAYHELA